LWPLNTAFSLPPLLVAEPCLALLLMMVWGLPLEVAAGVVVAW
jgi:hypothetical protein